MASTAEPIPTETKSKIAGKAPPPTRRVRGVPSRTDHGQSQARPLTPRSSETPKRPAILTTTTDNDDVLREKGAITEASGAQVSPRGDSSRPMSTPIRRSKSPYAHVQSRTNHGTSKPKGGLPETSEQADTDPAAASSPPRPKTGPGVLEQPVKGRLGVLRSRSALQQPVRSQGPVAAAKDKSSATGQRILTNGPTTGSTTANSVTGGADGEELDGAVSAECDIDPKEVACLLLGNIPSVDTEPRKNDAKPAKQSLEDSAPENGTQIAPPDEGPFAQKMVAASLSQGSDFAEVSHAAKQTSLQSASTETRSSNPMFQSSELDCLQASKMERTVAELQSENDRLAQEAQQQRMIIGALESQLRSSQGDGLLFSDSDGSDQRREVELLHSAVAGMKEQLQKARQQTSTLEQQCQVYQIRMEKLLRSDRGKAESPVRKTSSATLIPNRPMRATSQPRCIPAMVYPAPAPSMAGHAAAGYSVVWQGGGAAGPMWADPGANYYMGNPNQPRLLVPAVMANAADGQRELSPRPSAALLPGASTPVYAAPAGFQSVSTPLVANPAVTAVPVVRSSTPRLARPVTPPPVPTIRPAMSVEAGVSEATYQEGRRLPAQITPPRLRAELGRSISPGPPVLGPSWAFGQSLHSPRVMQPPQASFSSAHPVTYARVDAPARKEAAPQERRFAAHNAESARQIPGVDLSSPATGSSTSRPLRRQQEHCQTPVFMSIDRTEKD